MSPIPAIPMHIVHPLYRSRYSLRHGHRMLHQFIASTVHLHETQGRREDNLPTLPRLHRPRREALSTADALHMVDERDVGAAGQHKVAVHRVHREVGGNGALRSGETLRDSGAAVDTARTRGMP